MSRISRVVVPGMPHHVIHRGNRKQDVFLDDKDRQTYLKILRCNVLLHKIRIWAYALMPNHVHLICVPETSSALAKGIGRAHGAFTTYFNKRHDKVGHLWHSRFRSSVLDERHLLNATRYVERNPVRAKMTDRAESYRWSSAAAHCAIRSDPVLDLDHPFRDEIPDWSAWLRDSEPEVMLHEFRWRANGGHPIGENDFLRMLEKRLGRKIEPMTVAGVTRSRRAQLAAMPLL